MGKAITRLFLIIFPIGYMSLIWVQSSYFNPESIYELSTGISMEILLFVGICFELFHLFQFGILYLFVIMAILSFGKLNKWIEFVAVVFSVIYGIIDEIHQIYIPFRSFSIGDLLKDTVGVLVLSFIIHKSYFTSKKSKIGFFLRRIACLSDRDNRNFPL